MNKIVRFVVLPAIIIAILFALTGSLNLIQQAGAESNAIVSRTENAADFPYSLLSFPSFLNLPYTMRLQFPMPCYGPHMTANVSKTQVNINETIFVNGAICPPKTNATVIVTFVRPDYSYVNVKTLADEIRGEFNVSFQVDMAGLWNIFPIENHITDRLFVNVTDLSGFSPALVVHNYAPPPESIYAIPAAAIFLSTGATIFAVAVVKKDKTRKISSLRLLVQIIFVLLLFIGALPGTIRLPDAPSVEISQHEYLLGTNILNGALPDGISIPAFGCYYPCGRTVTCALWQIQTYIYPFWNEGHGWAVDYIAPGLERLALVFGIIIVLSILFGRVFCGWICPFGLYLDIITRLRKAVGIKHRNFSSKFNERFHQLSYVILAVIIILCVFFASQAIAGTQLVSGTEKGGFVYTYFSAPFCQVCPMKPLCILTETAVGVLKPEWTFGTTTGDFYQLGYYVTSLNLTILIIVTIAAFFFRRSWCRICPLGGLIALFNRFPPFKWISGVHLHKTKEKCDSCGVCKRVCPTQVTEVFDYKNGDVATSQCIMCLRCVEMCPNKEALKFKILGKTVCESRNWLNKN
jgi:ferredoxin-type protein NapH